LLLSLDAFFGEGGATETRKRRKEGRKKEYQGRILRKEGRMSRNDTKEGYQGRI
jgi:hypothetical protein